MYVGTYYNSYYNQLFGSQGYGSVYSPAISNKKGFFNPTQNNVYNQSLFNSDGVQYVNALKSGSSGLTSALKGLTAGVSFNRTAAVSSDTSAMTVAVKSGGKAPAESTTVNIEQLATGQVNEGSALKADERAGLQGYQQFEIEAGGKQQQFSFTASASDTNRDIQQKMADAANAKNSGVTATVKTDAKAGTSQLVLTAKETGDTDAARFRISDKAGGAVASMGAGTVTTAAADARYRVNGGETQTAKTNTVDLGGVTATLKKAGGGDVTVQSGTDKDAAIKAVKEFADSYNALYGATLDVDGEKSNKLFSKLVNTSKTYASSLVGVGIGFDKNGYMVMDSEKLGKAAEDGSLERFFTENRNTNYGYTNQLSNIARDVGTNSGRYVDQSSFLSSLTGSGGIRQLAQYNQMTNMGMLFDFWI